MSNQSHTATARRPWPGARLAARLLATPLLTMTVGCATGDAELTSDYNYERFDIQHYDHSSLPGPWAGQPAVDATLFGLDGTEVRLSDFKGKRIVLETGSLSCPAYRQHIAPMTHVAASHRGADTVFLVVYVREAHPGHRMPRFETLAEKIDRAQSVAEREPRETRALLVDDVAGSFHRAYGSMPNMVYVIDPSFRVAFRSDWTHPAMVDQILAHSGELPIVDAEHYVPSGGSALRSIGILLEAGPGALFDALRESLAMRRAWRRAATYYEANGTLKRDVLPTDNVME